MHSNKTFANQIESSAIKRQHLFVFPLAWFLGILSLQVFGVILPDSLTFLSSMCGTIVGVIILWKFFLRPLDNTISLPTIILLLIIKAGFVYWVWTNSVFAPLASADLEVARSSYFVEAYSYWLEVNEIVDLWRYKGFTFILPENYIGINHPTAMLLVALPFTALPPYTEVLIPWNMFYTTAAACGVYGIGLLEGFKKNVCKSAFFLVLIQPYGWFVWNVLKRENQCQMAFAAFLFALLYFRKNRLALAIVTILGTIFLSFYRIVYGPIIICTSLFIFLRGRRHEEIKILFKRLALVVGLILLIILLHQFVDIIPDNMVNFVTAYGVGNTQVVAETGYQQRITQHSFWLASVPERIALGLMSPFPWTNILDSENLFDWATRPSAYFHTALMLVCFITIALFGIRNYKRGMFLPASVMLSLMVAASGMGGIAVHSTYVQVGMLSTFPYVLDKLGSKEMVKWFFISVLFFLVSSLFWEYMR